MIMSSSGRRLKGKGIDNTIKVESNLFNLQEEQYFCFNYISDRHPICLSGNSKIPVCHPACCRQADRQAGSRDSEKAFFASFTSRTL
jgi:hypothetical protein